MKRFFILLPMVFALSLSACTSEAPTWQEQYDLGVRYLGEGNYEEAIIAFTAAIEIDPKQAPAYVGRGDAYIGLGETEKNLTAAQTDYEMAIELDETCVDAYLGLADVYIYRGDYDKALEILNVGLEKTGNNQNIVDRIADIENELWEQDSFVQSYDYIEFEFLPTEYQAYFKKILTGFLSNDIDSVYSALLNTETFDAIVDKFGGDEKHAAQRIRTMVDGYKIQLSTVGCSVQVRPESGIAYAAMASDEGWNTRGYASGECADWNWNGSYQLEEKSIDRTNNCYWEFHVTGTMKNCLVDGIQYTYEVLPLVEIDGTVTSSEEEYETEYENGKLLRVTSVSGPNAGTTREYNNLVEEYSVGISFGMGYSDYELFQEMELWN